MVLSVQERFLFCHPCTPMHDFSLCVVRMLFLNTYVTLVMDSPIRKQKRDKREKRETKETRKAKKTREVKEIKSKEKEINLGVIGITKIDAIVEIAVYFVIHNLSVISFLGLMRWCAVDCKFTGSGDCLFVINVLSTFLYYSVYIIFFFLLGDESIRVDTLLEMVPLSTP